MSSTGAKSLDGLGNAVGMKTGRRNLRVVFKGGCNIAARTKELVNRSFRATAVDARASR